MATSTEYMWSNEKQSQKEQEHKWEMWVEKSFWHNCVGEVEYAKRIPVDLRRSMVETYERRIKYNQEMIENLKIKPKPKYFAILSNTGNFVVGATSDPNYNAKEEGSKLVKITKRQYDTFGDNPGQWSQLSEIGLE